MGVSEDTSAGRVVALLEALAGPELGRPEGLTVSELADAVGRDKSSVSRQLRTFTNLGLVQRKDDGTHVLGWRVFTIAARAGDQRLLLYAPAVMRKIGRATGERVHLTIRRQDEVLTILSEGPLSVVGTVDWVGRTVPVLGTSSGRALMLDDSENEISAVYQETERPAGGRNLPKDGEETVARVFEARDRGFAVSVDEHEEGLTAV